MSDTIINFIGIVACIYGIIRIQELDEKVYVAAMFTLLSTTSYLTTKLDYIYIVFLLFVPLPNFRPEERKVLI